MDYSDFATKNVLPPGATSPYPFVLLNQVVTDQLPTAQWAAGMLSGSTSLVLPPGILSSGNSYGFMIETIFRKNIDI